MPHISQAVDSSTHPVKNGVIPHQGSRLKDGRRYYRWRLYLIIQAPIGVWFFRIDMNFPPRRQCYFALEESSRSRCMNCVERVYLGSCRQKN